MPEDLSAWIDAHDPPELREAESLDVDDVLARQREEQAPADDTSTGPDGPLDGRPDPSSTPIVNNVGDDGGAASG